MLRCGYCRVMLDQSIILHAGIPRIAVLYLYVDDVVDFHRRARQNGLSVPDPEATFYDMTEFRIEDPDGIRLWIGQVGRSEEHTSELQSLMRISYAVFCLKKKTTKK